MHPVTRTSIRRDAGTALGLGALALLGLVVTYDLLEARDKLSEVPSVPVSGLLVVLLLAPLALRRRFPTGVALFVGVVFAVFRVTDVPEGTISSLALFLAIYSAGAWGTDHRARMWSRGAVIVISVGVLVWRIFRDVDFVNLDGLLATAFSVAINAAFFVAAWLMGDLARIRRENEVELARRADQLAAEREERAKRAVLDERVRISRELHDVVAHHVSVMGVQAGAARRILSIDATRAEQALISIEESGRQAVGELQRLVGFLRSGDEADRIEPQPTLDDIDRLITQTRAAGLPVELRVVGRPRRVPDSIALSAYRIIQESLTNAVKHAGSAPTTAVLTFGTDSLDVEIVNARGSHAEPSSGGGRGLLGMRERASMVGGTLEAGPSVSGGYRVAARLPTHTAYTEGQSA